MMIAEKQVGYNSILEKSFAFAVRIVKFHIYELKKYRIIEPLLKQVLRSGTSIGANVTEAQDAVSKKDFINKMSISLKESRETDYWLRLFEAAEVIPSKEIKSIKSDNIELIKILTSIIKTTKKNNWELIIDNG